MSLGCRVPRTKSFKIKFSKNIFIRHKTSTLLFSKLHFGPMAANVHSCLDSWLIQKSAALYFCSFYSFWSLIFPQGQRERLTFEALTWSEEGVHVNEIFHSLQVSLQL